jgi:hypothetical protein
MRAYFYAYLVTVLTVVYIADRGVTGNPEVSSILRFCVIYLRVFCAQSMFLSFIGSAFSREASERFFAKLRDEQIPVEKNEVCINLMWILVALLFMSKPYDIVFVDVAFYYAWMIHIGYSMVNIRYGENRVRAAVRELC